jgi:hypothetical protein
MSGFARGHTRFPVAALQPGWSLFAIMLPVVTRLVRELPAIG